MSTKRFKTTRNLSVSGHRSSGWLPWPSYGASKKKGKDCEDPVRIEDMVAARVIKNMRQRTHLEILGFKSKQPMALSQRDFILNTTSTTTIPSHLQPSIINPIKQSMQRSRTSTKSVPVEMATAIANPPVEIGTRGTVGSLVMQEIEYFSQLELRSKDSSKKPHSNVGPVVPTQKKKKRGSSKLIPSICSMVEISDNRPLGISGLSYRNLKSDVNKLQV
ncbi:hypothetical protein Goshw_028881 [Gossypium schwendimanii]|uniref:Uncharacterized protein n=1 Tax=Gossypium schwendimanii TaxID=34291 RepID=A0A7J9KVD4_GOSSC|nr:hypothetical protein [Gossypium schwendimanii]